jgi:hypothetical protein
VTDQADRGNLLRQVDHWERALERLGRFDEIAAPGAWASLDFGVAAALQESFRVVLSGMARDVVGIRVRAEGGTVADLPGLADRIGAFRARYIRTETALDFYGDAVNSRTTPSLQALLLGLDRLAHASMRRLLDPLRQPTPGILTYVDRGLGASILKAGLRLWDASMISPVAAVKIARHNLMRPTALIHETGHQVAHVIGWNEDLGEALRQALALDSAEIASVWSSWASEIAADTYAFAQTGYASVANLHDVLAGDPEYVLRYSPGDPHPISYLRVLLGVEMCSDCYGRGPWQALAASWIARYPLADAEPEVARLITASLPLLRRIARLCLNVPLGALGGRALTSWLDPNEVGPSVLGRLQQAAGGALLHSPSWSRAESLRILALIGYQVVTDRRRMDALYTAQEQWLRRLGGRLVAA